MLKLQYFDHLMRRANSLEKTLMLGKIEGRRRRGQQDEMVGWNHWINRHESEQTPGDGEGQGSLACCSPWGCKESDMIEQLNNNPEWREGWRRQGTCVERRKRIKPREGKDHHSHSSWGSC